MLHNNKNSRDQRTPRNARLKHKIEAINQQSHQFNHLYFQFPEPPNTSSSNKYISSPFKTQKDKGNTADSYDPRRNIIKEKIKFRIKQELWNLLKKNNDREEHHQPFDQSTPSLDKKQSDKQSPTVCVKGRSFTRFDRDSQHYRKNWSFVNTARQENDRPKTERQNSLQEKKSSRRRVWSSVKMKQSDRAQIYKKQSKMNKTSFSLQKIEMLEIQPWKLAEDHENHLIY